MVLDMFCFVLNDHKMTDVRVTGHNKNYIYNSHYKYTMAYILII